MLSLGQSGKGAVVSNAWRRSGADEAQGRVHQVKDHQEDEDGAKQTGEDKEPVDLPVFVLDHFFIEVDQVLAGAGLGLRPLRALFDPGQLV